MTKHRSPGTDLAMFLGRVDKTETCWLWLGYKDWGGYGRLSAWGYLEGAHRVSYRLHGYKIPPGLELDHLCRVRHCVNPDHLEPVTRSENIRRGMLPSIAGANNAAKTHCPAGHPYDEENTYYWAGYGGRRAHRQCRTCRTNRNHERDARRRGVR